MKITASIAFLILLLSACLKGPLCNDKDKNEGIIEQSLMIHCEPITGQTEFIIDNDSIYQQTFDTLMNCTLPAINFNEYTLLGLYAEGQCEIRFDREVKRLEDEQFYLYKVIVHDCGLCKSLIYSYNWVTVPKLPAGWTVTFETTDN
jgi:hypothetical protein